eukprot:1049686-Rhodomonas_salina.1
MLLLCLFCAHVRVPATGVGCLIRWLPGPPVLRARALDDRCLSPIGYLPARQLKTQKQKQHTHTHTSLTKILAVLRTRIHPALGQPGALQPSRPSVPRGDCRVPCVRSTHHSAALLQRGLEGGSALQCFPTGVRCAKSGTNATYAALGKWGILAVVQP